MYQKFSFVAIQIQMIKFISHKHTSTSLAVVSKTTHFIVLKFF